MTPGNPYLDHYFDQLAHQREHMPRLLLDSRPHEFCVECLLDKEREPQGWQPHDVKTRFAWAVPNDAALDAVARWSPGGVVEIGAGAGYWAGLLRARGVDVAAYDPAPPGVESDWHAGYEWSPVERGDHQVVTKHPDRTLLMVWPSIGAGWSDEAVSLFEGDTVVYVGETRGGCTGSRVMHELLGEGDPDCWCVGSCTCQPMVSALFRTVEQVDIPQWWAWHDRLSVHRRVS